MQKSKHPQATPADMCDSVYEDDGIDPRKYFANTYQRKMNRKTLQLCSQVGEVINSILVGECGDDVLKNLFVQTVVPAPNADRLLVTLGFTTAREIVRPEEVIEHLYKLKGYLRTEMAGSVNRKRVPDLAFQLTLGGEVEP